MIGDIPPLSDRARRLQTIYRAVLFVFIAYVVVVVSISATRIIQVGAQVQDQTTFIVNYLRCIGQTPQSERDANATNACFEKYAPGDVDGGRRE